MSATKKIHFPELHIIIKKKKIKNPPQNKKPTNNKEHES